MKIGIDARLYGTKNRGLGRYVKKLVDGLTSLPERQRYVIFLNEDNFDTFSTANPLVKKVLLPARWYSVKEQWLALKIIKPFCLDLMHWPHFNVPYFYQQPFIVTIHDLIINHFPNSRATTLPNWQYWLKLVGYRQVLRHAVLASKKIIVPSQFVKEDLLKFFKVPATKISVIYEGYFLDQSHEPAKISRLAITKPFLLYVGAAYPHKNLEMLVRVFKQLNKEKRYQLVLVGSQDNFYQRLKDQAALDRDIIFTGFVAEGELAGLYQQALAYIFPSLYEGFGLPPLEAQAHGLPVISSKQSCLPEILADSVLYFDPKNPAELLQKLQRLTGSQSLRAELRAKGLKNIQRFSWQKMVKETLKLYLA